MNSLKIYDENMNIRYFRNNETFSLIEKIDGVSNRKIKGCFDVKQGIVSGADFVNNRISKKLSSFGINVEIGSGIFVHKNEDIKKLKFENFYVEEFYKNSDISPYCLKNLYSQLSILYLDRNIDEKSIPNIIGYLEKFKPILSIRREVIKGYISWFYLQWPRKKKIFSGEKIVVPQRNLANVFAYSNEDFYASADVYYITAVDDDVSSEEFKYLTGILNSKLYYFWLYNMGKRKGQLLEMYSTPIKEIKYIGYEGLDWQEEIVKKVNEILKNKENFNLEKSRNDIELLINKGYFLNPIEIEMIEAFYESCGRI
jgi:adenine-specific DNA-methyltransferase